LLGKAIIILIATVIACIKKFKFTIKRIWTLFIEVGANFLETFMVFCSLMREIFWIYNFIDWVKKVVNFVSMAMEQSIFITRIIFILYLIILGLFGILIGFLIGMYSAESKIYIFYLLELLDKYGLIYLLKLDHIEQFSTFSVQTVTQIEPALPKVLFKSNQKPKIPFPVLGDPFIWIEADLGLYESQGYKFELFKFYRELKKEIKN
jgi:hypothetical protein